MKKQLNQNKMEKEFVPYELAVKLKELGFDEPCLASWIEKDSREGGGLKLEIWCDEDSYFEVKSSTKAPTFSQSFRWFREEYKMNGYVSLLEDGKSFCYMIHEDISVVYGNRICSLPSKWLSHEEAELDCLERLIEIVESKSE